MSFRRTVAEMTRLIEVAQGLTPADVYVANGHVLNVFSREVIPANVALVGGRIAYVGSSEKMVGPSTQIVDARDHYVIPGFVEPHTHLDVGYNPTTLSMGMLEHGTTNLFSSHTPLQDNMSLPEFRAAMEELFEHPARIHLGLNGEFGISVGNKPLTDDQIAEELFSLDGIFGICEVSAWSEALRGNQELLELLRFTRRHGKTLEGHTVGANYDRLNAIVSAGYTSCHEPINVSQALDRLRVGLWVMLRHNNIRPDLPELVKLLTEQKVNTSRLMWTADGLQAPTLIEKGHLDHIITYAVELGADPITAIQMATINPATYFGLDDEIGAIAPGREADMLLVKDLRTPTPRVVISRGRTVYKDGELLIDYPRPAYYARTRNVFTDPSARLKVYSPEMFLIPAEGDAEFPVVRLSSSVLTRRQDALLRVRNGHLACDPDQQILHFSVTNPRTGAIGNGFVTGVGFCPEGMAFTNLLSGVLAAWGTQPKEMARAANRARALGGGIVIMHGGESAFEMPLPLTGSMSIAPLPEFAAQMTEFFRYMHGHGFPFEDPFYTTRFVTWVGVPEIRLSTLGVVDAKTGAILFPPTVPEPANGND